jgi:predicted phage terminase large subunit-like protein
MTTDFSARRRTVREHAYKVARLDFFAFYRLVFSTLAPEAQSFLDAKHYQALAAALQKVVTGETPRLLIAIPPRHGKSVFASVALPAWILGSDPKAKIICGSYGDQLAKDFALRTRELLRSSDYQAIFPDTALDVGGTALEELRTTAKGYRLGTSVQGVVTGKGADYIILDDPMKAIDASSDSARNAVYEWVKGSLMTRFDKPAEGRMVVVMQRLHQDDLIGRLLADGGWDILEMPGECLKQQIFDLGHGRQWTFNPGDLLFPERFDAAVLQQSKYDLGEVAYNAQILQRPTPPGGALFKLKHFQRYKQLPQHFEAIIQSWDPAYTETETAAFTVCTTWGILGRKLYLIDVLRKRLDFYKIEPAIISMKQKYNATGVILEISGVGKAIGNSILRHENSRRWFCWIEPQEGKVDRATAQTPKLERKYIYLPETADWLETFEAEIAEFPFCKYFDQVDSMVHFLGALDGRNLITSRLSAFPEKFKAA